MVLARKGGRSGALLMVTEVDLEESFLKLSLGEGVCGVNFEDILDLRLFIF